MRLSFNPSKTSSLVKISIMFDGMITFPIPCPSNS